MNFSHLLGKKVVALRGYLKEAFGVRTVPLDPTPVASALVLLERIPVSLSPETTSQDMPPSQE